MLGYNLYEIFLLSSKFFYIKDFVCMTKNGTMEVFELIMILLVIPI